MSSLLWCYTFSRPLSMISPLLGYRWAIMKLSQFPSSTSRRSFLNHGNVFHSSFICLKLYFRKLNLRSWISFVAVEVDSPLQRMDFFPTTYSEETQIVKFSPRKINSSYCHTFYKQWTITKAHMLEPIQLESIVQAPLSFFSVVSHNSQVFFSTEWRWMKCEDRRANLEVLNFYPFSKIFLILNESIF